MELLTGTSFLSGTSFQTRTRPKRYGQKSQIIYLFLFFLSKAQPVSFSQVCSALEKSPFGAKSDFEIWAFKVFLFFGPEKSSKEGLEVATPENLKWKKYIRQSENANGSPLEPLWGSKKLKVSTKRTLRPTDLPFWFGEKSSWCKFEKKEKIP